MAKPTRKRKLAAYETNFFPTQPAAPVPSVQHAPPPPPQQFHPGMQQPVYAPQPVQSVQQPVYIQPVQQMHQGMHQPMQPQMHQQMPQQMHPHVQPIQPQFTQPSQQQHAPQHQQPLRQAPVRTRGSDGGLWRSIKHLAVPVIVLGMIGSGGWFGYGALFGAANTPADSTLAALGKIIELPNEEPRIATVSDVSSLPKNFIFEKAQIEDEVFFFERTGFVVLYRPSIKKVISMAPIEATEQESAPTPVAQATSTVDISPQPLPKMK